MPTVKVTHPRFRVNMHTGLNGRLHAIELGREMEADEELIKHLRGLGATVDVASERAGSPQEGSGGGPALSPAFAKFDHNGDGRPGGSKPKRKKTTKTTKKVK